MKAKGSCTNKGFKIRTTAKTLLFRLLTLLFSIGFLQRLANAVDCSHMSFKKSTFTVCQVNADKEDLQLFWLKPNGEPFESIKELNRWVGKHGRKLEFATNAGIFSTHDVPLGLYIEDGRKLVSLNLSSGEGNFYLKPNGVFLLEDGGPMIVESSQYSETHSTVSIATQSGPLLVLDNQIHPAFVDGSNNRCVRSGVAVSGRNVLFVISEGPINFYDFSVFFRDRLKCKNALYLDGVISKMYCPSISRKDEGGHFSGIFGVLSHQ